MYFLQPKTLTHYIKNSEHVLKGERKKKQIHLNIILFICVFILFLFKILKLAFTLNLKANPETSLYTKPEG